MSSYFHYCPSCTTPMAPAKQVPSSAGRTCSANQGHLQEQANLQVLKLASRLACGRIFTLSTNQKWSLMGETFQLSKIARARMVFVTGTGVQVTAASKPSTDSYCSNGSNFSSSSSCSWTFFARPQLICFSLALACIPHISCEAEPNARDLDFLKLLLFFLGNTNLRLRYTPLCPNGSTGSA